MERDPGKMKTAILRDRMNMLKNTKEGIEKMEDALEKYVARRQVEAENQLLYRQVHDGVLTAAKAAEYAGIPTDDFEQAMSAYEADQLSASAV